MMELRAQPDFSVQLRQRAGFATAGGSQGFDQPVRATGAQLPDLQRTDMAGDRVTFGAILPDNFNPERLVQSENGVARKPYRIQLTSRRPFQAGAALTGLSALGLATPLACFSFLGIPAGMAMMGISALGWGQTVPANVARGLRANALSSSLPTEPAMKSTKPDPTTTTALTTPKTNAKPMSSSKAIGDSIKLPDTTGLLDSLLKPLTSGNDVLTQDSVQTAQVATLPQHPPVAGKLEPLIDEWFPPRQVVRQKTRTTQETGSQKTVDTLTLDEFKPLVEKQGLSYDSLRAKLALAGERRKVQQMADEALTSKREQLQQQNLVNHMAPALLDGQGLQPSQALWLRETAQAVTADLGVEPGAPDAKVVAYPWGKTAYAELTLAAVTQLMLQEKEAHTAQHQKKQQVHLREQARHDAQQANEIRHVLHETVQRVVSEDGLSATTRINGQRLIQALSDPRKDYRWEQARAAAMTRLLGDDLPDYGRIQPFEVAQALIGQGQVRPAEHWQRVLLQIAHGEGRIPVAYEVESARSISPPIITLDNTESIAQAKIAAPLSGNPVGHWWQKLTQPLTAGTQVSRLPAHTRSDVQESLTQGVVTIPTQAPVSEYVRAINLPAIVGPLVLEKLVSQPGGQTFLTPEQATTFDQLPRTQANDRTKALAYLDRTARLNPANIWRFIDGVKQGLDTAGS